MKKVTLDQSNNFTFEVPLKYDFDFFKVLLHTGNISVTFVNAFGQKVSEPLNDANRTYFEQSTQRHLKINSTALAVLSYELSLKNGVLPI